jgi:hypothetical protein
MQERDDNIRVNPTHQGCTWTAPLIAGQTPITGLGGTGRVVAMGDLSLPNLEAAQMCTLLLGMRSLDNPDRDLGPSNIRGRVQYGVGAIGQEEVRLDWGFETSITLPAGHVHVEAYEHGDASGAHGIPVRIMLTAMLVKGCRQSQAWPTYTESFFLVDNVPEFIVPPPRARRLIVSDYRGQAGSDITVITRALNGAENFFNLANAADSAIRTTGIVLSNTTTMVEIESAAGTGIEHVTATFLLDG